MLWWWRSLLSSPKQHGLVSSRWLPLLLSVWHGLSISLETFFVVFALL